MLTIDQINNYFEVNIVKRNPRAVMVEYLQYEILDSMFKFDEAKYISFIGGTAVRIVAGSNRFSEDLDFDNLGLNYSEFEGLLNDVLKDMRLKGFEIEYKFVEKGAWHCYIKFPELLYRFGLSVNDKERILIRIDMQEKDKLYEPKIVMLNKFGIFRKIFSASSDILLSQKLITILQRKREKGRDLYDVSYLFGLTKENENYIYNYLNLTMDKFYEKLNSRINELDLKKLAKDVEPFLINPDEIQRVLFFKELFL